MYIFCDIVPEASTTVGRGVSTMLSGEKSVEWSTMLKSQHDDAERWDWNSRVGSTPVSRTRGTRRGWCTACTGRAAASPSPPPGPRTARRGPTPRTGHTYTQHLGRYATCYICRNFSVNKDDDGTTGKRSKWKHFKPDTGPRMMEGVNIAPPPGLLN